MLTFGKINRTHKIIAFFLAMNRKAMRPGKNTHNPFDDDGYVVDNEKLDKMNDVRM